MKQNQTHAIKISHSPNNINFPIPFSGVPGRHPVCTKINTVQIVAQAKDAYSANCFHFKYINTGTDSAYNCLIDREQRMLSTCIQAFPSRTASTGGWTNP
jgi:hypothetical protein